MTTTENQPTAADVYAQIEAESPAILPAASDASADVAPPAVSCAFRAGPRDHRCKNWTKRLLPDVDYQPGRIEGAGDIPGSYIRPGEIEIFPGEYIIEGEANHHTKNRGWSYWAFAYDPSGRRREIDCGPKSGTKDAIKAAVKAGWLDRDDARRLLEGAGPVAAVVRACMWDRTLRAVLELALEQVTPRSDFDLSDAENARDIAEEGGSL